MSEINITKEIENKLRSGDIDGKQVDIMTSKICNFINELLKEQENQESIDITFYDAFAF